MKLILAEKPSVAKNIADALQVKTKKDGYFEGNGYIITWAFGHLVELYDAKDYDSKMRSWKMDYFPFIPKEFKYKVKTGYRGKTDAGAAKQLKIIQSLMNRQDVEMIISACDYDREGQLIGDSIIYRGGQQKKPVYRLLLNEWTPKEVLKGLKNLKPNHEMASLRNAGISRQWADWVIGINLTSVATLKYQHGKGRALNIGRVLLPTLKIIYDRDQEIEHFVPEDYFKLTATFQLENGHTYEGTYAEGKQEKFKQKEILDSIHKRIKDQQGQVIGKKVDKKKELPPLLFNLSGLQGYMTNKYKGWTSDKVLKVAQSLYEKKYITYPRTASIALEESLVEKTKQVLQVHAEDLPYKDEIKFKKTKRIFNNAKVESHSAIIPTYLKPAKLSKEERMVYEAVKNRFIMQFMPAAAYEETVLKTKIEGLKGLFISKGKMQLSEGWKKVEHITSKDKMLPKIQLHDMVSLFDSKVTAHQTKPPKHHTEKTLLRVMETCGKQYKDEEEMKEIWKGFSIGTPATRAETIKKLKDIGYIRQENKYIISTDLGRKLVETFPVHELFNLDFTGRLEKALFDIQKGQLSKQQFLDVIYRFTEYSVEAVKKDEDRIISKGQQAASKPIGKCPECGGMVREEYKSFSCENWKKGCSFVIWKQDKYLASLKKRPTKTLVKAILQSNKAYVKGLTSKKGKKFNAYLSYQKYPNNEYYSWKMTFTK